MAGEDNEVARQGEKSAVDRIDDRCKIGLRERGVSRSSGEERVSRHQNRVSFEQEAHRTRSVSWGMDRAQSKSTDFDHVLVVDDEVIGRKHRRVRFADPDVDTGIAKLGDCADVICVAVRGEDAAHTGRAAHFEEQFMFIGGVDEHGVACLLAPNDVDVIVERADDELVDPGISRLVVRRLAHAASVDRRGAPGHGDVVSVSLTWAFGWVQ